MVAAGEGHLPVARLLVETYHCNVNEEDGDVSEWELMEGVSEHSTCVSFHMRPSDTGSRNTRCAMVAVISSNFISQRNAASTQSADYMS